MILVIFVCILGVQGDRPLFRRPSFRDIQDDPSVTVRSRRLTPIISRRIDITEVQDEAPLDEMALSNELAPRNDVAPRKDVAPITKFIEYSDQLEGKSKCDLSIFRNN